MSLKGFLLFCNVPFESAFNFCFSGGQKLSLIDSIFHGSTWHICPRKKLSKQ